MSSVCDSYWSNDYHEYRDLGSPPRSFHLPPIVTKIWGRWGRETGSTNRIQSLLWEVFIRQGRKWPRVFRTGSVFLGRGTVSSTPISVTMLPPHIDPVARWRSHTVRQISNLQHYSWENGGKGTTTSLFAWNPPPARNKRPRPSHRHGKTWTTPRSKI